MVGLGGLAKGPVVVGGAAGAKRDHQPGQAVRQGVAIGKPPSLGLDHPRAIADRVVLVGHGLAQAPNAIRPTIPLGSP